MSKICNNTAWAVIRELKGVRYIDRSTIADTPEEAERKGLSSLNEGRNVGVRMVTIIAEKDES